MMVFKNIGVFTNSLVLNTNCIFPYGKKVCFCKNIGVFDISLNIEYNLILPPVKNDAFQKTLGFLHPVFCKEPTSELKWLLLKKCKLFYLSPHFLWNSGWNNGTIIWHISNMISAVENFDLFQTHDRFLQNLSYQNSKNIGNSTGFPDLSENTGYHLHEDEVSGRLKPYVCRSSFRLQQYFQMDRNT